MSWIQTYTGKVIEPLNVTPENIDITDIAHALSMICRFNGHCIKFYSVAEHSVVMSRLVPPGFAFEALMHDAAEAYVSDVASPIKHMLPVFKMIEMEIDRRILERFSVNVRSGVVQEADLRMLATERDQIMHLCRRKWECLEGVDPYPVKLECWDPDRAAAAFMSRFLELTEERS